MLGQHPQTYGFPELNLFLADSVDDLLASCSGYRQIQLHGLLRTVAELFAGEQTLASIDMARRWLIVRRHRSTADLYVDLCRKLWPLRGIDKSPAYALKQETLHRIIETFPGAYFMHLTRNPRSQGESVMKVADGLLAVLANSIDYATDPPTIDPQIAWYTMQQTIMDFLANVPGDRVIRLRGEDVLNDPDTHLRRVCRWLGIDEGEAALNAMRHPERSPFASLGPFGAHLGNDIAFLQSPALRAAPVACPPLAGPLPWRRDGAGLRGDVLDLARHLGYT